jgi:hypothetical protein
MSGALNIFRTVTANVTTSMTTVYSTPLGYATVVLMAQMTNIDPTTTMEVSANLSRPGGDTALSANAPVPVADAITVLTGRLIMNYGDHFQVSASANNSVQLTLSLLETLTG